MKPEQNGPQWVNETWAFMPKLGVWGMHKLWQFNKMKPEQNGWHLADYIFKCTFLRKMFDLLSQISPQFVL